VLLAMSHNQFDGGRAKMLPELYEPAAAAATRLGCHRLVGVELRQECLEEIWWNHGASQLRVPSPAFWNRIREICQRLSENVAAGVTPATGFGIPPSGINRSLGGNATCCQAPQLKLGKEFMNHGWTRIKNEIPRKPSDALKGLRRLHS
jgi:hypothetical protein